MVPNSVMVFTYRNFQTLHEFYSKQKTFIDHNILNSLRTKTSSEIEATISIQYIHSFINI